MIHNERREQILFDEHHMHVLVRQRLQRRLISRIFNHLEGRRRESVDEINTGSTEDTTTITSSVARALIPAPFVRQPCVLRVAQRMFQLLWLIKRGRGQRLGTLRKDVCAL